MPFPTKPNSLISEYISNDPTRWDGMVVIFPGGGYHHHSEHEGKGYADFLLRHGISSCVAHYRVGSNGRHPDMLEDALHAISYAQACCKKEGLNPQKVGLMGSSAGGHLAAHAMSSWIDYDPSLRPAFAVLAYPVIDLASSIAHTGSRDSLLGENASDELASSVSAQNLVHQQTPPVFIWHTAEDTAVPMENSLVLAAALRAHSIPFELRLYNEGKHGLGLNTTYPWGDEVVTWLRNVH